MLDVGPGGQAASPVWDPVTGFGGNGDNATSCISDGPFANLTLHIADDESVADYCVSRMWNETVFQYANQTYLDRCFALASYASVWECFHDAPGPHTASHTGTGGVVCPLFPSRRVQGVLWSPLEGYANTSLCDCSDGYAESVARRPNLLPTPYQSRPPVVGMATTESFSPG